MRLAGCEPIGGKRIVTRPKIAPMWPHDPNWRMTVVYLVALGLMGFAMKVIARFRPATVPMDRPCVFWLLLSPPSNRRLRPIENIGGALLRFVLLCAAVV